MQELMFSSKIKKTVIIIGILFAVYNIIVFVLCGFTGHGASFWLSYLFMNLAIILTILFSFLLKGRKYEPRDWFLGYPFYRHCVSYLIIEMISSILFMGLDYIGFPWQLAFVVQIIIVAIFLVLIISCVTAKEMIEQVQTNVESNTHFMEMFLIDVENIAEKVENENLKKAFRQLCDEVRYSDPVSDELLNEIENRLTVLLDEANTCIACNDIEGALMCCKKTMLLLSERNRKCKALKLR